MLPFLLEIPPPHLLKILDNPRQFNERLPPQMWYMMKCFYLLLAAYQLRQGYPTRILGNFLCQNYSIVNYVLFKGSEYFSFIKSVKYSLRHALSYNLPFILRQIHVGSIPF